MGLATGEGALPLTPPGRSCTPRTPRQASADGEPGEEPGSPSAESGGSRWRDTERTTPEQEPHPANYANHWPLEAAVHRRAPSLFAKGCFGERHDEETGEDYPQKGFDVAVGPSQTDGR